MLQLFCSYLRGLQIPDLLIAAPDMGNKAGQIYAKILNADIAICVKLVQKLIL